MNSSSFWPTAAARIQRGAAGETGDTAAVLAKLLARAAEDQGSAA